MTNDINTENEELRKMLEEQKRVNENQKLVNENQRLQLLNLEREKKLREANDTITNLCSEIIKVKEENKNKGNKRYDDVLNNIKNYKKIKKKTKKLRRFLVNVKILLSIQFIKNLKTVLPHV